MPWKIVNLNYDCAQPHLHVRDPGRPIHMRTYFGSGMVEVGIGAEDPDDCRIRAFVTADAVRVDAIRFKPEDYDIIDSILTSLDVETSDRRESMRWMDGRRIGDDGYVKGNVKGFERMSTWPRDLTDAALLESLHDDGAMPTNRRRVLRAEAKRRRLL